MTKLVMTRDWEGHLLVEETTLASKVCPEVLR